MKKFYYLLILIALGMPTLVKAQSDKFFEGFETGYTDGTYINNVNGWTKGGGGDSTDPAPIKTHNDPGKGYDGSDWYMQIEIGNYYIVAKNVFSVVSGEDYVFKFYAQAFDSDGDSAIDASAVLGNDLTSNSSLALTTTDWTEVSQSFHAGATGEVAFRIGKNWGKDKIKIDNVTLTCTTCETTGVEDRDAFEFSMYPNPVKSTIYFNSKKPVVSAKVYDMLGKELVSFKYPQRSLDISALNKGLYILKLESDNDGVVIRKFVKD